jgi:hypothetical protein
MFGADPMSANSTSGVLGGGSMANFSELMRLIETTISPDVWLNAGGTATMSPFRQNLSLIVNAPQETHEQIADLLKSLCAKEEERCEALESVEPRIVGPGRGLRSARRDRMTMATMLETMWGTRTTRLRRQMMRNSTMWWENRSWQR